MVMFELFRVQAQTQAQLLANCVHSLARDPLAPERLDACASAARSFERTAQMVGLDAGAELARTMEECVAAVRRGELELQQELIGLMLQGVDVLGCMAKLPHATQPALEAGSGPRRDRVRGKGKPVLVVDDSADVRELERKLLSFRGYDVVTAADGVDAWQAVRDEDFELVITDMDMPQLDGLQLIRLIREDARFELLRILIACDSDSAQERWRAFDAGADYYVIKGQFHDTLVEAVANLIGPAQP
jgi:CheY-like chemotaxis protein